MAIDRFADIIKRYREENGLSQRDLAKKLHITQQYLSRIENCEINPSICYAANILGQIGYKIEFIKND